MVDNGAHSSVGASSAHRWLPCPGSVSLSQGRDRGPFVYSAEGTVAHAIAEECLSLGFDAADFIGDKREADGFKFVVDAAMAEAIQVYVDSCRRLIEETGSDDWAVEERHDLSWLRPQMFGTTDFRLTDHRTKTVYVWDLKFGRGHVVEVENNPQGMYYAINPAKTSGAKKVVIGIVQPRAPHEKGAERTWTITAAYLRNWAKTVLGPGVDATREKNPKLAAGEHCKFCPALGICPEAKRSAQKAARLQFDEIEPEYEEPRSYVPTDAKTLGEILERDKFIRDYLDAVKEEATNMISRGGSVPGFKLVRNVGRRKWKDEEAADKFLAVSGVPERDRYKRTLLTPYQAAPVLKHITHLLNMGSPDEQEQVSDALDGLQEHVEQPEGAPSLVPESHGGTEVERATDQFDEVDEEDPDWDEILG